METMQSKIALIGCGSMAQRGHGLSSRYWAERMPGVVRTACCDVDAQKVRAFGAEFGFPRFYTDYRRMLAVEKPDGVILLVPPNRTAEVGCEVIAQGIHLFTKKPPGRLVCARGG